MFDIQQLYELFLQHPKVITDSRKIEKGCLFFALKGENFNGNEFADQAIAKGAAYAIIDEARFKKGKLFILVENVLETLQLLAKHHRSEFNIPVIAITGSNGKTTTKELVSLVLGSHYQAHFTKGNFNNHIGVPLTLLDMPANTEVAIIEMGANHLGEIEFLCSLANPTHGLITNIGKAHLEGFGNFEGVKKAKSELYRFLAQKKGVAFINEDESFLQQLASGVIWQIIYKKGPEPASDKIPFEVQLLSAQPFVKAVFASHEGENVSINSNLAGEHNFNNIITAAVLGTYFKVPGKKIKEAIESYVPANNRSQLLNIGRNTFILDAYNANPSSMLQALKYFSEIRSEKKVAVLGAMKELGGYSEIEHANIVRAALGYGFEKIITVGNEYSTKNKNDRLIHFQNTADLKDWFALQAFVDTYFLIKGSRSIGLEKLIDGLQND